MVVERKQLSPAAANCACDRMGILVYPDVHGSYTDPADCAGFASANIAGSLREK